MTKFDEIRYLNHYPDVRLSVINGQFESGLDHWNKIGSLSTDKRKLEWEPADNNKPIRICMVTPTMGLGGAERWIEMLLQYTNKKKAVWSSIVMTEPGSTVDGLFKHLLNTIDIHNCGNYQEGVTTHSDPQKALLAGLANTDAVVVWGNHPINLNLLDNYHGRVIIVSHGSCDWSIRALDKIVRYGSHYVAVSEASRATFRSNSQFVTIIRNGANLLRCVNPIYQDAEYRNQIMRSEPVTKIVGFIGRFSPEKDPLCIARALLNLPGYYMGLMVGSGWDAVRTMAAVKQLVGDRVVFLDPVENISNVLRAMDCLVLTSPSEGSSLVLLEAWAAGCPTICTEVGSVPELERLYGDITISVPIDPTGHELAQAVRMACAKRDSTVVLNAKQLVLQNYTCEHMAERWVEYLEQICREDATLVPIQVEPVSPVTAAMSRIL